MKNGIFGDAVVSALLKPFMGEFRGEPTWSTADEDGRFSAISVGSGIRWQLSGIFFEDDGQRYLVEVIVQVRLAAALPEMASWSFGYQQLQQLFAGTKIEVLSGAALWSLMKEPHSMDELRERCKRDIIEKQASNNAA